MRGRGAALPAEFHATLRPHRLMHDLQREVYSDRRAHFEAHGWIVLRGLASESELVELNRVFDDLMSPFAAVPRDGRSGVAQRPVDWRTHAVLLRHVRDGVAAIACDLLGARSVQLLQNVLLLKHPSATGTIPLHQDYSYTGYLHPPSSLSVALALNDASIDGGCLYVVDASHTWGLVGGLHVFADGLQNDLASCLSPLQRERVANANIPLAVRAGDVTIHHCLTLHGSGNNTSARPRRTIVTHLFDGDCTLAPERLPREARDRFATDGMGHLTAAAFPTCYPPAGGRSTSGAEIP